MIIEREQLEAAVGEAERRQAALTRSHAEANAEALILGAELAARIEIYPQEFDSAGTPKPKTAAAKLAGEIRALHTPDETWMRVEVAKKQTRKAHLALDNYTRENAAALVGDLGCLDARAAVAEIEEGLRTIIEPEFEADARAAVAGIEESLRTVIEATLRWEELARQYSTLLVSSPGIDGRDIPSARVVSVIRGLAENALDGEIPLPLPRSRSVELSTHNPKGKNQ